MALAFDPTVSPHYKIVYAKEDNSRPRQVHVEIYSSETGNWSLCGQTFSLFSFAKFDESVVYWRGALHWMSRDHVYHFTLEDTENPHFIQVEDHRTLYGQSYERRDKLFVSRDCLLLVRMLQLLEMNVHEMNADYSGWSVKYHVNLESVAAAASLSFPEGRMVQVIAVVLGEREEASFLVLEVIGAALIQYNIISKTFHQLCDLTQIQLCLPNLCDRLYTPSFAGV